MSRLSAVLWYSLLDVALVMGMLGGWLNTPAPAKAVTSISKVWENLPGSDEPPKQDLTTVLPLAKAPLSIRVEDWKAAYTLQGVFLDGQKMPQVPDPDKVTGEVILQLPMLPRGLHTLTLKYKDEKGTPQSLASISVKVLRPTAPTITNVFSTLSDSSKQANLGKTVSITTPDFYIAVDATLVDDKVIASISGEQVVEVVGKPSEKDPPYKNFHITPTNLTKGKYTLTVRILRGGEKSFHSIPVLVDYPGKGTMANAATAPNNAVVQTTPPAPQGRGITLHKRPHTAFFRMPRVREVPDPSLDDSDSSSRTGANRNRLRSLEFEASLLGLPYFHYHFDMPAHFPIPRFGEAGEPLSEEGAVLYEGMRFLATPDGQYEVDFNVSTPATFVTLRLQLLVVDPVGRSFTLTLPPIAIKPRFNFEGNYVGGAFQVRHAGFSPLVAAHFPNLRHCGISRQGTARFNSWPQDINQFGLLIQQERAADTSDSATDTAQGGTAADQNAP